MEATERVRSGEAAEGGMMVRGSNREGLGSVEATVGGMRSGKVAEGGMRVSGNNREG